MDTNSTYLVKELRKLGVEVEQIVTVKDDMDRIGSVALDLSARHDYVFSTGGVGATHDDVTMQALARAFNTDTVLDPGIMRVVEGYFGKKGGGKITEDQRNLARVPRGATLYWSQGRRGARSFPLVRLHNIFILPGIPHLVERKFQQNKSLWTQHERARFVLRRLFVDADEMSIIEDIHDTVAKFKAASVSIGSYPSTATWIAERQRLALEAGQDAPERPDDLCVVTFEARGHSADVDRALDHLRTSLHARGISTIAD